MRKSQNINHFPALRVWFPIHNTECLFFSLLVRQHTMSAKVNLPWHSLVYFYFAHLVFSVLLGNYYSGEDRKCYWIYSSKKKYWACTAGYISSCFKEKEYLDNRWWLQLSSVLQSSIVCYKVCCFLFVCLFVLSFCLSRAAPAAYGGSQARGRIRAVANGLCHSHGNAGSLTHWVRPGINPETSWFLVGFVSTGPQRELPVCLRLTLYIFFICSIMYIIC